MRSTLAILLWFLVAVLPIHCQDAQPHAGNPPSGNTGIQRFEIGVQTADIRTECIGKPNCEIPSVGLGAGGALNLNPHFSLDASFLTTPASGKGSTNLYGGRASELLAGARVETRAKHYGFFLKAQSGYFHWNHVITAVTYPSSSTFTFQFGGRTYFAGDVGAGFEYSPSARIHVRGEATDLILHPARSTWENNVQPLVGIYYGLGKQIAWQPPVYDARKNPPFFSPVNIVLLTGSTLAITADAITTQRFLKEGYSEGDPFARPLVKYGWSGQITAMSLEIGGETLGMYGLHRIRQHWIEHMVPVGIAIAHGVFAYNNARLSHNDHEPY